MLPKVLKQTLKILRARVYIFYKGSPKANKTILHAPTVFDFIQ